MGGYGLEVRKAATAPAGGFGGGASFWTRPAFFWTAIYGFVLWDRNQIVQGSDSLRE
jgi:hypothetical protein